MLAKDASDDIPQSLSNHGCSFFTSCSMLPYSVRQIQKISTVKRRGMSLVEVEEITKKDKRKHTERDDGHI